MMEFNDFYTIAEYGNENWKGSFTPREIANNAYDYLCEFQASKIKGKPTHTMIELCKLICEDMGKEIENILTVEKMNQILSDFILEI